MDLNVDAGEGDDPVGLVALATSVNVACGFHAGSAPTMAAVVAQALRARSAVGAHPSYPDREGFGRRPMDRSPDDVAADVLYQVGALAAICRAAGTRLHHVKLHGALYHAAWRDAGLAGRIAKALAGFDAALWVYAPPGSALAAAARAVGLPVAHEGFADRGVSAAGGLLARGTAGALISEADVAAARAVAWARAARVASASGAMVDWPVDTFCVHSDTPGAVAVLRAVREALIGAGLPVGAPTQPS